MPRSILVVPCYNEARRLPVQELEHFARTEPGVDFVLVNDGSTDETLELLRDLAARLPGRFDVVDVQPNRGKAEAVRFGMQHAFRAQPAFAGYWDADLATPLDAVAELEAALAHHPELLAVFGSRVKLLGRSIERRVYRHYLGRVFATAASLVLGLPIYDTQCGAKLFRVCDESRALFEQRFTSGWIFDVEILARLICARRAAGGPAVESAIYELPLREWRDVAGSKITLTAFPRAALELLRIRLRYFGESPTGARARRVRSPAAGG
jgi:dolichyl-phosphate beta-glucosyltransferase